MKERKTKQGFTLIEAVLVLAIAGLIFLMIFVALPSLQRQSRDTQRREDMAQLISAIKKYQQNNRGAIPTGSGGSISRGSASGLDWGGFYHDYLKEGFTDPSGGNYVLSVAGCGVTEIDKNCTTDIRDVAFPNNHKIYILTGATCDGEVAKATSNFRKLAILYKLEGGGVYCGST